MSDDRFDVAILGEKVGTATGWDGDELHMFFYDFKPKDFTKFPDMNQEVDLSVLYETGDVEMISDQKVLKHFKLSWNLIELELEVKENE